MRKELKILGICLTMILLLLLQVVSMHANGWVQEGKNWKYEEDGQFLNNIHKNIDGKWYLFDENNNMVTGLYQDDDKFYYFSSDGTPANGPIDYNGKKYYISNKGEIKGITEEEFYDYQDSLAALYITGGGFDYQLNDYLKLGMEQANNYFNTLPLSRSAFKKLFKIKGYNDDFINYVLNTVNINWKDQALKCAKEFYDKSQLNRLTMKALLIAEDFSEVEASYGTEMVFANETVSSGVGKKDNSILLKDYLDKMSEAIIGIKISNTGLQ